MRTIRATAVSAATVAAAPASALRAAMEAEGFSVREFEWWHFDDRDWRLYPIGTATFEAQSPAHPGPRG